MLGSTPFLSLPSLDSFTGYAYTRVLAGSKTLYTDITVGGVSAPWFLAVVFASIDTYTTLVTFFSDKVIELSGEGAKLLSGGF